MQLHAVYGVLDRVSGDRDAGNGFIQINSYRMGKVAGVAVHGTVQIADNIVFDLAVVILTLDVNTSTVIKYSARVIDIVTLYCAVRSGLYTVISRVTNTISINSGASAATDGGD